MYSELFNRYSNQLIKEIDKYKSMYLKCCEKINKQKKIIKSFEEKIYNQKSLITDLLDKLEVFNKKKES